jgi:hypothetical protein
MPFALQYKSLIDREEAVSISLVRPRNIYRINSYKYSDGVSKTLTGADSSLVFLVGIHDKKLLCVKISMLRPDIFLRWIKDLFAAGLTHKKFDKYEKLEDLLILADRAGNKIFNGFVKPSSFYNKKTNPYRTYSMSGIKNIQEVHLKKDLLKNTYGLPAVKDENGKKVNKPITAEVVRDIADQNPTKK